MDWPIALFTEGRKLAIYSNNAAAFDRSSPERTSFLDTYGYWISNLLNDPSAAAVTAVL